MKIAIEGCAHGELETIYNSIRHLEEKENVKIDLLICCGDFQATRNLQDLSTMAVPAKYKSMCSFFKYYSGEKIAPILTIFIGGNHEASNHLQELPYGGWAAPNIYYLGYANVLNIAGVRIAGLSGIYKGHDYPKGRFEKPPYSEDTKRSVYHIRNLDVFRLKQLKQPVDIFLSHDWPRGIHKYGDEKNLLRTKPFFRNDIQANNLGSKPCEELLQLLKPSYWFSAHLHVKFAAIIPHSLDQSDGKKITKFLALDKCLPRRQFLQILDIPHDTTQTLDLRYDLEWLAVLYLTNHLISVKKSINYMPGPNGCGRWIYSPSSEELEMVKKKFGENLSVPNNFVQTVTAYQEGSKNMNNSFQPSLQLNPQTMAFCERLGIDDPLALLSESRNESSFSSSFSTATTFSSSFTDKSDETTTVSLDDSSDSSILANKEEVEIISDLSSTSRETRNSSTPLSVKRLSLVLPSPCHNLEDSINKDDDDDDAAPESSKCSDDLSQESDVDDISTNDGVNLVPETCSQHKGLNQELTEMDDSTQPKNKKFRRRNHAIYSSADED